MSDKYKKQKITCLKYLEIYLNSNDLNGHLFRTFVDDWHAYYKNGPFLNKKGKPKWFNNPDPFKEKKSLLSMDFISDGAMKVINGKIQERLVKDHSIPIKVLRTTILEELGSLPSLENIEHFLIKYYRLGVITKSEDKLLNDAGLRDSMPIDWNKSNSFARYDYVSIVKAE